MVIDKETNFVYFFKLLSTDNASMPLYKATAILGKHQVSIGLLSPPMTSGVEITCRFRRARMNSSSSEISNNA